VEFVVNNSDKSFPTATSDHKLLQQLVNKRTATSTAFETLIDYAAGRHATDFFVAANREGF